MPKQDSTRVPPSLEVLNRTFWIQIWARSDDAQSVQPHYNADPNEVDWLAKDLHGSLQEGEAGKISIYQKKGTHCESNPPSKRLRPTAEPWHPSYAFSSNDAIASGMPKFSALSQNQRLRPTATIFTPSQMKTSTSDAFPKSAQNEYAWKERYCQVPSAASSSGTKELRQAAAEFVPINHDAFPPQSPELTFAFPPAGAYQDSDYHHHAFPMSNVSGQSPVPLLVLLLLLSRCPGRNCQVTLHLSLGNHPHWTSPRSVLQLHSLFLPTCVLASVLLLLSDHQATYQPVLW